MRTRTVPVLLALLLPCAAFAEAELVLEGVVVQVVEPPGQKPLVTIAIDRQLRGQVKAGAITFQDPGGPWRVGERSRFFLSRSTPNDPLYQAISPDRGGSLAGSALVRASERGEVVHAVDQRPRAQPEAPNLEANQTMDDADRAWGPADEAPSGSLGGGGLSVPGLVAALVFAGLMGTITLRVLRRK